MLIPNIEPRPDTSTGIRRVRLGRGSNGRQGWGVLIHNIVPFYWAGAVTQKLLAFSWAGAVSPPSGARGGRGGRGEGRGRVGCRIHDNFSRMWLGRGKNA